ncbi:MAG: hypothetical protein NW241_10410 [Bacteroidia bacterium]|nr:hypothetical protein [Bacteroidia bacterium]
MYPYHLRQAALAVLLTMSLAALAQQPGQNQRPQGQQRPPQNQQGQPQGQQQGQRPACMRDLMGHFRQLHAYWFVDQSFKDSLQAAAQGKIQIAAGNEAAWQLDLLRANLDQVTAIRPAASNPCAQRVGRAFRKYGMIALIPNEQLHAARSLGYEPASGAQTAGGEEGAWAGLLNGLLQTLNEQNPWKVRVDFGTLFDSDADQWYAQPVPAAYVPAEGAGSLIWQGKTYVRIQL